MKDSIKKGLNFGLASGTITTLGLMVGLYSGTGSELAVLGGVLTIAIADSFSDALGVHISEESVVANSKKEVWEVTIYTFLAKMFFTLSFVVPILVFNLERAILVSMIWGMILLSVASYKIAKDQKDHHLLVIAEHLFIGFVVVVSTHLVGDLINSFFETA